jgi:hypothetical protein
MISNYVQIKACLGTRYKPRAWGAGQVDVYTCKRKGEIQLNKGKLFYYSTVLHGENDSKTHNQEFQG